jgi:hypothetical protein
MKRLGVIHAHRHIQVACHDVSRARREVRNQSYVTLWQSRSYLSVLQTDTVLSADTVATSVPHTATIS